MESFPQREGEKIIKLNNKASLFALFPILLIILVTTHVLAAQRFIDNGDNTVTDMETGLMWQKNTPSPIISPAVIWSEAKRRCEELILGGYNDWRLPTKDEWETIIDRNNQYPALVYPNPFGNVIVNSPYWTASEYSYGPDYTCDSSGCPLKSYVVLLYLGYFGSQSKNNLAFFWPVRTVKNESLPQELPKVAKRVPDKSIIMGTIKNAVSQPNSISTILFKPEILSDEVILLGIDQSEKINQDGYIQTPITKDSRIVIKSKEEDIEIAINIYQIDLRRVTLFNSNAVMIGLPVRMKLNKEQTVLIFFQNHE